MAGTRSSSGLIASCGSDLDTRIPRKKMPSRALPDSVRSKLRMSSDGPLQDKKPKQANSQHDDNEYWAANKNVFRVPKQNMKNPDRGQYRAGSQKHFLKRGSGQPMSSRASRLAQMNKRMEAVHSKQAGGMQQQQQPQQEQRGGGRRKSSALMIANVPVRRMSSTGGRAGNGQPAPFRF